MSRKTLTVVFAGSGGAGAVTAGALLLRAAAEAGYYGLMQQLAGAQVRGGEAASLVEISTEPLEAQPDRFDLFVAIDWENVERFAPEIPLDSGSVVIADPDAGAVPAGIARADARTAAIPFARMVKAAPAARANMIGLGAVVALAGLPDAAVEAALQQILGGKGEAAIDASRAAMRAGAEVAAGFGLDLALAPGTPKPRWLVAGNEALGLGALEGGIRFVAAYPITPATDLVEWMAPELHALGGRLVLAEDELASINMVLGASFGGVPSMTVTSGPGFALMIESLSLAVSAEIPLVLIDVMRGGPSTGIPTKSEQSDLDLALTGTHGDAPRVVLAPMSIADCARTAEYAVYVAEALQVPTIVLSDQSFGQARAVIDPPGDRPQPMSRSTWSPEAGTPYKRYVLGGDPVTPFAVPGTPDGQWVAEGLTHNEYGLPSSAARDHVAQMDKRLHKLDRFDPGPMWGEVTGEGTTAVIAFGSSVGPARETAKRLARLGQPIRVIGLRTLAPLPKKQLAAALDGVARIVVLEQNHSGQLYRHLLGHRVIPPTAESIARPGPLPFRPAEVTAHLI